MPELIGTDYRAFIPTINEDADIVQALKDYHLGASANVALGIEDHLKGISDNSLSRGLIVNKGAIIAGTAFNSPSTIVAPAQDGYVLETDISTNTGLVWRQSSREQEQIAHIMGVY
jgi:hypothetical protein